MTKDKEEAVVQPGASGDELMQIVEGTTPENPQAQEAIRELAAAKSPLELMEERISTLEQKNKISCLYSCSICPSSFVERLEELEERTNNFCPSFSLSVTDARQIQIALTESIKLSLGYEAYVCYKVRTQEKIPKQNIRSFAVTTSRQNGLICRTFRLQ